MTVTLLDVARLAGVSEATASRVLNGRRHVASATRERVERAAIALDYLPNHAARDLSTALTATVTLLVHHAQYPAHGEGTVSSRVVDGISRALRDAGYDLLYAPVDDQSVRHLAHLGSVRRGRTDGIIVLGPAFPRPALRALRDGGRPMILIDNRLTGVDAVLADNRPAMRRLAEHLVDDHGYRRLVCLAGPTSWPSTAERIAGVRDALAGRDVLLHVRHARETTMRDGATLASSLFDDPPEAVVAVNDAMAIGALHRLRASSRDTIPITGFDDIAWARLSDPPLTTVAVDATTIGVQAATLLLARMSESDHPRRRARELRVPAILRLRRSCGCESEPDRPTVRPSGSTRPTPSIGPTQADRSQGGGQPMRTNEPHVRWRLGAVAMSLAIALAACTGGNGNDGESGSSAPGDSGDGGGGTAEPVVMISSQLVPTEEQEIMNNEILANFEGEVEFVGLDAGPFNDQIRAQHESGEGEIAVIGGLSGEFEAFGTELLMDLSDVATELADLGINEDFLELGKLGTDTQYWIPWMQATYIMVARNEALEYLPNGADINSLTWEQVTEWGANIEAETGERRLGFPAGEDGLWHRFFQGYAYPSFTGGVNTTFTSDAAVEMWDWLAETWPYVNPQSTTYGFMQEPLQAGEVWVAWDHVVRLIDALESDPEGFTAFPAPAGPAGRAFMPVIAGLAVPATSANPDGAKELIRYLLSAETQATTLSAVSFFPVIGAELEGELSPGLQAEADAVLAMQTADDALPALLPTGLGEEGGAYNQVFRDAFQRIVGGGEDPATVLDELLPNLQAVFEASGAACWPPDPASDGPCQPQ